MSHIPDNRLEPMDSEPLILDSRPSIQLAQGVRLESKEPSPAPLLPLLLLHRRHPTTLNKKSKLFIFSTPRSIVSRLCRTGCAPRIMRLYESMVSSRHTTQHPLINIALSSGPRIKGLRGQAQLLPKSDH